METLCVTLSFEKLTNKFVCCSPPTQAGRSKNARTELAELTSSVRLHRFHRLPSFSTNTKLSVFCVLFYCKLPYFSWRLLARSFQSHEKFEHRGQWCSLPLGNLLDRFAVTTRHTSQQPFERVGSEISKRHFFEKVTDGGVFSDANLAVS